MAKEEEQLNTLVDYARPILEGKQSSIVWPPITANTFELKASFMQIVQQSCSFHGLPDEDPNTHFSAFLEVCDMLKLNGISNDPIFFRVFLFSLKLRLKEWV